MYFNYILSLKVYKKNPTAQKLSANVSYRESSPLIVVKNKVEIFFLYTFTPKNL